MRSFVVYVAVLLASFAGAVSTACGANDPIPLPKPGFDAAATDAAKDVTSAEAP